MSLLQTRQIDRHLRPVDAVARAPRTRIDGSSRYPAGGTVSHRPAPKRRCSVDRQYGGVGRERPADPVLRSAYGGESSRDALPEVSVRDAGDLARGRLAHALPSPVTGHEVEQCGRASRGRSLHLAVSDRYQSRAADDGKDDCDGGGESGGSASRPEPLSRPQEPGSGGRDRGRNRHL